MNRREFITLVAGRPRGRFAARAQEPRKLPTIGLLGSSTPSTWAPWVTAFVQRLSELGWIDGRNVTIEYRWAEGRSERVADWRRRPMALAADVPAVFSLLAD